MSRGVVAVGCWRRGMYGGSCTAGFVVELDLVWARGGRMAGGAKGVEELFEIVGGEVDVGFVAGGAGAGLHGLV